ncbi:MAG: peptidoglycan-binding protein [Patescibacteria group bacterium]
MNQIESAFRVVLVGGSKIKKSALIFTAVALVAMSGFFYTPVFAVSPGDGDVVINEFSSASDPEWVELLNTTASPVDLTGWTIQDLANPQLLSDLGTIPANGIVVFEHASGWLNNTPDTETITIFDDTDTPIHSVSYGSDPGVDVSAPSVVQSAVFDGTSWSITSTPTKGYVASIASADPADVNEDFIPQIDTTLARGSEAYLGRTTNYIGPVLGAETDSIKWKVTVNGPSALTSDMVDLDEVGWTDQTDSSAPTDVFHYPFMEQEDGSLVATGSCDDTVDMTDHTDCATDIGFSLDENDVFTNADKIKFNSNASLGNYIITYELVNTSPDPDFVLSNAYVVNVNVTGEVTLTRPSPDDLTINATTFEPALESPLAQNINAYYSINSVSSFAEIIPGVQWKITIEGPAGFVSSMVDLDEIGWKDLVTTNIETFHYPFTGSGTLVAQGSESTPDHGGGAVDSFGVDLNDNFTNVDRIRFTNLAPLGTYTIKRQLVYANGSGPVSNELTAATIEVVYPAIITIANPTVVSEIFIPQIDTTLARGSDAYIGRATTYTGPVLGADTDSIKWKVTVSGPGVLTPNMVDLDEVGFNDPDGAGIVASTFHYPFTQVGVNLIVTGSCDVADLHDNGCATLVGFSLDANDVFTNADKIKFNSNAPAGSYTITYELVDTADNSVVGTHVVTVEVITSVITLADPADVNVDFSPQIGSTLARGSDAYIGRATTYTGPAIGTGDPETIKWKVTVNGPSALTADMVDLDEVGWKDQTDSLTDAYHYPLAAVGNDLVATGSCDAVLPSGHDDPNTCTTDIGFSLVTNDVFTNADKIKFNSNAPAGSYTITYELVDTADNLVVGTHTVTVNVLLEDQVILAPSTTLDVTFTEAVVDGSVVGDSTITVPEDVNDATLNVAALQSGDSATLPVAITVNSDTTVGNVSVAISSGTTITAPSGSEWTGIVNLPQVKANSSVNPVPLPGNTADVSSVIEIGYGDTELLFSKAVRILIAGQAGKYAGYSRGGAFTNITTVCDADNQAAVDAQLGTAGDCKIDVGSDLVIWTKHFTSFTTYTQGPVVGGPPANSGGGGTGGGGGGGFIQTQEAPTPVPASALPSGQVLGVSVFQFTQNLKVGSRGSDVEELQKRLAEEGIYSGGVTGYFGPLTEKGVKAYQQKYGISATGFVGPLTRARLNGSQVAGASTTSASREALNAQVLALQVKLLGLLQQLSEILRSQVPG